MPEHFTPEEIERVKRETDMVALVRDLVGSPVKPGAGGRYVTHCPFHEEKSPSFTIYPDDDPPHAHCFGCGWPGEGKMGDAIRFYQEIKGFDFPTAMRALGGVSEQRDSSGKANRSGTKSPPKKRAAKREPEKPKLDAGATADREAPAPPLRGKTVACVYDYERPDGTVAHQKIRYEPKEFRQRRPVAPGEEAEWQRKHEADPKFKQPYHQDGWAYSMADAVLYPYRLPEMLQAHVATPVFFCEGEKDADTVASLGLCATTFTDKEFRPEYASWFQDRWIVVVEDYDKRDAKTGKRAGLEHAKRLGREMMKHAARVTWVRMPDLWSECEEGTDVTDWVVRGRETFEGDEDLRRELLEAADAGEAPLEVMYEGFFKIGERDGVTLIEDVLASRVVQHRRLMYAGGDFWQWRVKGQEQAGTWRKMLLEQQVEKWVRDVMRTAPQTRPLINSRNLTSLTKVMRSSNFCHPNDLNGHDPYLLNCKSGMLNVLKGELHPHEPKYLSTTQSPVTWNERAECPLWMEVLERIQPDPQARDLIQEMFGYCLVPAVNYHVFFFLYGDGGTGKSTVADILVELVGEANTMALQLEELGNAHLRSQLVGKQLYMAAELTTKSFKDIGLIKAIVGGDQISVDVKYGPIFAFRPKGRLVMTSNVVAHTPDTSGGFERRFMQIDFNQVIPEAERDYELMDKLRAELPGILRWAVEGFQRLHERGRFERTEAAKEATKTLMRNRASVKEFLHDEQWIVRHGVKDQEWWVCTEDLFHHYEEWCDFYGVNAYYESDKTFIKEAYRRMDSLQERRKRRLFPDGSREVGFWGLERKTPEEWQAKQV